MSSPSTFSHIVTRIDRLKQLSDQAERLVAMDRRLGAVLGEPLRRHARLATIREGCLVIQAETPAWASRLRFRTPEILARLRGEPGFEGIRSLRIRVRTDHGPRDAPPARKARISDSSAAALTAQAATIADTGVREALLRLAARKAR